MGDVLFLPRWRWALGELVRQPLTCLPSPDPPSQLPQKIMINRERGHAKLALGVLGNARA